MTRTPSVGAALERWRERHLRILMLAPTLLILAGLTLFPTIYMFTAAVQKVSPDPDVPREFIGLGNFTRMLSDPELHLAIKNTVVFTSVAVTLEFLLGLGLALLFDKYIHRLTFLKTVLLVPMMIPPIAVALTWKLIYQPQFGVLNELMFRLGLPSQAWAGDVSLAMATIIAADVWEWTPFIFLLMLAGLASLPSEPYEAAQVDGASAWRQFWDLTIPFLKPVIAIALLLRIMDALRLFDLVFILTVGGPAGATETLSLYIFKIAFTFVDIGYAAAVSLVVLFVTVGFSTWFIKRLRLVD
ncbi:multiple sugar transport system permease protein [Mycoplana sp. BE70]|uniref:carbohydrate ABC transporter permease n=1 Tax=Mycoplana sp. BE70 TaxID=2817775 RepID=UPI00285A2F01|nr:sugar ABC transporter permease [Mycoplana sp. BE70]MDR6757495.1 multiple sugar transport system permease protein [Mycoplana sp. BE70]